MATGRPRIKNWENGGSTTLDGAINDSVTTLVVDDETSFPTVGDFDIRIDDEIINVTHTAAKTYTIERGAEGTTAASHADAAVVTHIVTGGSLDRGYKDNFGFNFANGYPYNRILNEGATATASSFTWLNQGTATVTDANDGGLVMKTGTSEALTQIRGKYITAPSTPWTCAAYVHLGNGMDRFTGVGTGTNAGLIGRESATGKLYYLFMRSDVIAMWRLTNVTTFSADVDSFIDNEQERIWFRMGDDGVDVYGEVSYNGNDWEVCFNEARTSFMAGGIDQIGFAMQNGQADANAEVYFKSWILE